MLAASTSHLTQSAVSCRRNKHTIRSRQQLRTQALFGWGKKDADKEAIKDEQYRMQQELLAKRKTGEYIAEAGQRRSKVRADVAAKKAARQNERDELAEGRMPDSLKNWKNYKNKEDETAGATGRIVVPLLPFGINSFDEGERFDLRSPYADDGWVDPDEVDMWAGFKALNKKVFSFGKKEPTPEDAEPKKIIWASQYGKYMADQKRKQAEGKQQAKDDKKRKS